MREFYLLLNVFVAVTLLILGVVALLSNRKSLLNKLFLTFTLSVGVWLVAASISNDVRNSPEIALYGKYAVFFFSFFSSYLLLWFAVRLSGVRVALRWLKRSMIPVAVVGILSCTPLVVRGVELQATVYGVLFGPLIGIYAVTLIAILGCSVWALFAGLKHETGHRRSQIKSLLWALCIALPVLVYTQFIAPSITGSFGITDIGILFMALPVASLYFSVIRHGLFDIRRAVVRSVVYVMTLLVLALFYYGIVYAVSAFILKDRMSTGISANPVNVLLALVLAFMFQPIRGFFDKVTNDIFYRDRYDAEDFFARFNETLNATTDLRGLLQRAAEEIRSTLKVEQAFFYVRHHNLRHTSAGTKQHGSLRSAEADSYDNYVLTVSDKPVILKVIDRSHPLYSSLSENRIAILIPLLHERRVLGYLALGEQRGKGYTDRDVKVLSSVRESLIIAIRNALSVQEVKDLNASLQQRIDDATKELRESNEKLHRLDATKDEFVSMASHQLRTPLTSVKGYISMVLDGDAGKITDMQRQLLGEAFTSSERMVHLINDFLNVSRLQTGKFMIDRQAVDFASVVEQEVQSLQSTAQARHLTLRYRKPQKFPLLYVDEGKFRQVIMNFIDNAFYYSREHSTITVSLETVGGEVVLRVRDAGMGVPEAEQKRLFTKFFRATNARKQRPDGTGVGLFLAKKVVTAHGGSMVFESVEGKGSTFGFRLPIKKLSLAPKDSTNELK